MRDGRSQPPWLSMPDQPKYPDLKPKSILRLRRREDGLHFEGDVPERHEFSARWVGARVADGEAAILFRLSFVNGTALYEVVAAEGDAWEAHLVEFTPTATAAAPEGTD